MSCSSGRGAGTTVCRHEVQLLVPLGHPAVQDGVQARHSVGRSTAVCSIGVSCCSGRDAGMTVCRHEV